MLIVFNQVRGGEESRMSSGRRQLRLGYVLLLNQEGGKARSGEAEPAAPLWARGIFVFPVSPRSSETRYGVFPASSL